MILKIAKTVCLIVLLLTMGWSVVRAEEPLPLRLQELSDETYRLYSARETDDFFEAVKMLKSATEYSKYQETYYRAYSWLTTSFIMPRATIVTSVCIFVGDAVPSDDLTKMCIKL